MADKAYDADHLRQAIAAKGALAVIPNNPSRALKYPFDKHLYAQRHLVECCFSKLKQFPPRRDPHRKDRQNLSGGRYSRSHAYPVNAQDYQMLIYSPSTTSVVPRVALWRRAFAAWYSGAS